MNIVIYESGSRGGNFDYSRALFHAYAKDKRVGSIQWVVPPAADVERRSNIHPILCDDQQVYRSVFTSRLGFFYRSFVNPLVLLRFLRKQKKQFVLLNDFEQLSAILWVPLYSLLLRQHTFMVVLHDPDRDAYPPSKWFSALSMKIMMKLMTFGLYHESLPVKSYYQPNGRTTYLNVVHGQYLKGTPDPQLFNRLQELSVNHVIVSIIGNVRAEKNYEMAITAAQEIGNIALVIAGSPSSSGVDIEMLKSLAAKLQDRVIFIIKYLNDSEMSAVIESSSVVLLNYKRTFASQSGILNLIAPYKKKVVISDTDSALARISKQFGIGYLVKADDQQAFNNKVREVIDPGSSNTDRGWGEYSKYASWENHVNIVLSAIEQAKQ